MSASCKSSSSSPVPSRYLLVTPARDEAKFIGEVIKSVLAQTIKPMRWVIVSDGSTDGTDEIVAQYASENPWILLVRNESAGRRSFGSKAFAFKLGLECARDCQFDYIGNLDADITLEPDYYARILAETVKNPKLGVASGVCWDKTKDGFRKVTISYNHAVGAVQFFRRECFEAIGGYRPATVGGIDALAELTARMKGWETTAFPELRVFHHKPVDSAGGRSASRIVYRAGLTEYHLGTHPLFAALKALRRWRERPLVISPFIRLAGYFKLWFLGAKRDATPELTAFVRKEQMKRLRAVLLCKRNTDRA